MNIIDKLKQFNVEVTPDMEKAFSGEFLSEKEVEKKLSKAENDRDSWKQRAETAEETLKGFDGKDFDTITRERDEWKKKAETAEKDYSDKMAAREKADLLKEAFADIKFSSEAAKKSIMSQIEEGVSVKNGKLIGFNDLLEEARKNDASAFVDEQQQRLENNRARFTSRQNDVDPNGKVYKDKAEIMKIKDPGERQRAWAGYLANNSNNTN